MVNLKNLHAHPERVNDLTVSDVQLSDLEYKSIEHEQNPLIRANQWLMGQKYTPRDLCLIQPLKYLGVFVPAFIYWRRDALDEITKLVLPTKHVALFRNPENPDEYLIRSIQGDYEPKRGAGSEGPG